MTEARELDFGSTGIIPVTVQDSGSMEILVTAYTNQMALEATINTGIVTFWSRQRGFWIKGEISGNRYFLTAPPRVNCDGNSLVYLARPEKGGMCHVLDDSGEARVSCFYRQIQQGDSGLEFRMMN